MIKLKDIIKEFFADELQTGADKAREKRSKGTNVQYIGSNKRTKTAIFKVKDPNGSGKYWETRIRFPEYSEISRQKKGITRGEKISLALNAGHIKVFCECPDFLYKGFKYMATEMDYGIRKETRPPNIKNKEREGTVCKHVLGTFDDMNNFIPEISKDMYWPPRK